MNWIEMLWAILTFVSVILFICGSWVAHYKIRLLNYIMLTLIVIYCAEMMQTITHLTKTGYLFRMLTWTVQASFIAVSIYRAWPALWLTARTVGWQDCHFADAYVMLEHAGFKIESLIQEGTK